MSRSGYTDDCWGFDLIMYRGAVDKAIAGRDGQAFLLEMIESLDALATKELIPNSFVATEGVCALGSVALKRGLDTSKIDVENDDVSWKAADLFKISPKLAAEIMYMNDERGGGYSYATNSYVVETPDQRWKRIREWAVSHLKPIEVGPFVLTDGVRYKLRNGYVTSPMKDGRAIVAGVERSWDEDGECRPNWDYEIVGIYEAHSDHSS